MKYRTKLLIYFTALFAVFTLLLVIFQYNREKQYKRDLLEARLRGYADLIAQAVEQEEETEDSTAFVSLVRVLPDDLRLTVISRRGIVQYESTDHALEDMDNHIDRPEVSLSLKRSEGSDIRVSDTDGLEYFYFAKVYNGYIVRVALPFNGEVQNFLKAGNVFLWFVLMLFPVALVALVYISDRFGKAVSGLRIFMKSADRGLVDYDHISFPHSELGDIGRTIMQKYKQLEDFSRQIALERERLLRHLHYFEEGIAIFSPDCRKTYANPRFMQYVNVILDRPTADINALWQHEAFAPALEFLRLNTSGTAQNQTRSTGPRPASAMEAPIFKFNVQAGGTCFSVQMLIYVDGSFELTLADVTEAEKSRKLKQQMSNNITHELRTPVSSIRGFIETIISCPNLSEERKAYFLNKAHAQVIRLTDLIRDVALITKTEEAPDLMPKEEINIARVVEDVCEELQQILQEGGVEVCSLLNKNLKVHGNYTLIYSIFRNLLENTAKYAAPRHDKEKTSTDGESEESSSTKVTATIQCYSESAEFAYFSFADTGCGVPEKHLGRLFERFYRISEGRTRENGGTGLGLSIVRNAVLFHQGDISVRNRKGGGLEFLFTLHK